MGLDAVLMPGHDLPNGEVSARRFEPLSASTQCAYFHFEAPECTCAPK